ncbi:ABC-ATPase domain-containing protein [Phormidium tenue]|uniref:ATPase n=1 Tax=Phormidium tenue NIES-30 TaxID=549789 RepID=A0A1U7IYW8_9CYAN|nr:ABC-ATPase domain-containing protein [Phormidium tenue]MBD2234655.1 ABC-ATPase domain-containing protein [Phormidium tenue FACHB-1052]OKH44079.1 ATPase [Phormidium tenue NIES-30]
MTTSNDLHDQLHRLDGQGYGAYKAIKGEYDFGHFVMHIDHVQGDPFAAPSRVRVVVPQAVAGFPKSLWELPCRAIALADYLTREFYRATQVRQHQSGSGKSGLIGIVRPSQAMLNRSAARVTEEAVELRFTVGLPAFGRRIAGRQAAELLCQAVPDLVEKTLFYSALDGAQIQHHADTAEDAEALRSQLSAHNLVAFVADGAILPRRSGVDERPLVAQAVPFTAPESLRVTLRCPHAGAVTGMGIPAGITLIVGGGYHGKSTLLRAIEMGVYNHIPGDGRHQVVTDSAAVKVRAEDGRSIAGVNISPFIGSLPQGKSTQNFSTPNASGSTSQAANMIEAIEAGATALLVDEDTSATNFMIRDRRMQALIAKDREPITPFIDKVRQLYTDYGISTVLVMGGSGDYFDVSDTVIAMDEFCPQDVTERAKAIAVEFKTERDREGGQGFGSLTPRIIQPDSIDPSQGKRSVKLRVRDVDQLQIGTEAIDLSAIDQLVEPGQVRAIAAAIVYAQRYRMTSTTPLLEVITAVMADLDQYGLDCLTDWPMGDLVGFRGLELAASLNRLRTLKTTRSPNPIPTSKPA